MTTQLKVTHNVTAEQVRDMIKAHQADKAAAEQAVATEQALERFYNIVSTEDYHPALKTIDRAEHGWIIARHLTEPRSSGLDMPMRELRLNDLFHPVVFYTQVPSGRYSRDYDMVLEVDGYARDAMPPLLYHMEMTHPFIGVPDQQSPDKILTGILQLGIALDPWLRLPFDLRGLNQRFLDYRLDVDFSGARELAFHNIRRQIADIRLFERHADDIERLTGHTVEIAGCSNVKERVIVALSNVATVHAVTTPDIIEFDDSMRLNDALHIGHDIQTGEPATLPLQDLPHLLICGQSGSGKSVALNSILHQFIWNEHAFDELILCDLKGGVELGVYEDVSPKIRFIDRYADMADTIIGLLDTVEQRLDRMRQNRQRATTEPLIALVIDEYAALSLQTFAGREEKQAHAQLMANLNNLAMRGRAPGIRIIASLQKSTTDVMDSSFKTNLQGRMLGRVYDKLTVAGMFGDAQDLPMPPAQLGKGQFIIDLGRGDRRIVQCPYLPDDLPIKRRADAS